MTSILVVAAHPDDEVLGCGGVMARHAAAGDEVRVIFLADGVSSRGQDDSALQRRMRAARAAAEILGAHPPVFLGMPDNRMDSLDLLNIVQALEEHLFRINPEIIYTHSASDLNIDHRLTHQVVLTACRPQPGSRVRAIHAFEVPSATHWASYEMADAFKPTRFVDISDFLETKLRALACYEEEMRPYPHARSSEAIEALARFRGSTVGLKAAEAFVVIRQID
jgi:LmbE family N-acetylglucosaminyl deacetylase